MGSTFGEGECTGCTGTDGDAVWEVSEEECGGDCCSIVECLVRHSPEYYELHLG